MPQSDLTDHSIYFSRPCGDIIQGIESGTMDFIEKTRCIQAYETFQNARSSGQELPAILADVSGSLGGLIAWGLIHRIKLEDKATHISLRKITVFHSNPNKATLTQANTTPPKHLTEKDTRSHRLVLTPAYLTQKPKTFLLTWNPQSELSVEQYAEMRATFLHDGALHWNWRCAASNKAKPGDRFLFLRLGSTQRGILGSGWLRDYVIKEPDGEPQVDIIWDRMLPPDAVLNPKSIKGADQQNWSPKQSGAQLDLHVEELVWRAWKSWYSKHRPKPRETLSSSDPHPPQAPASYLHSVSFDSWTTQRERDPANRKACLDHWGHACHICGMDFLSEYGEIGRTFIQVHHEHPVATTENTPGITINAVEDMKPVCPNCHAMLHFGLNTTNGEARTIKELKKLRKKLGQRIKE